MSSVAASDRAFVARMRRLEDRLIVGLAVIVIAAIAIGAIA